MTDTTTTTENGTVTDATMEAQIKQSVTNEQYYDRMAVGIAAILREKFTDTQRLSLVLLAESVLERVIEDEVREALSTRFEALYEGVIASVMQKLLMQALTQRANDTLKALKGD